MSSDNADPCSKGDQEKENFSSEHRGHVTFLKTYRENA